MRRFAAALAILMLGGQTFAADEVPMPQPQGAQGHFCLPAARLYRRLGFFFCAERPPPRDLVRTLAVVGPDREAVTRALLAAFAWARPATDVVLAKHPGPDLVVVATSAPVSAEGVLAELRAQGFAVEPSLRVLIVEDGDWDRPPDGVTQRIFSLDKPASAAGGKGVPLDAAPYQVIYRFDDHLTEAEARRLVAKELGLSSMLTSAPRLGAHGVVAFNEDPRVFVPAEVHMP